MLEWSNSISASVLVELLHVATLMHDDVVDRSELRRGIPAVQMIWKNKISVLMGDFLFSRALINLIGLKKYNALEVLSNTAERMSKGELLQLEKNRSNGMDEETYFRMISDKTASLISASCEIGALTTSDSAEEINALKDYGENLGIAFQIKDDLFDYSGSRKSLGKPVGRDVKDNLMTLPVIYALSMGNKREARGMVKALRSKKGKSKYKEVAEFVGRLGAVGIPTSGRIVVIGERLEHVVRAVEVVAPGNGHVPAELRLAQELGEARLRLALDPDLLHQLLLALDLIL